MVGTSGIDIQTEKIINELVKTDIQKYDNHFYSPQTKLKKYFKTNTKISNKKYCWTNISLACYKDLYYKEMSIL